MREVFYNQHTNMVAPHFIFMRLAQIADGHALKQHQNTIMCYGYNVCAGTILITMWLNGHVYT